MKRKHSFNFLCGCVLLLLTVLLIAGGLFLSPYNPDEMDSAAKNLGPSLRHLFGTDHYGRDVYTRVAHGSLTTMLIGALTVLIGGIFGTLIGALAGYIGGVFDAVVMRINDCLLAFPSILLALMFVGIFGPSEKNVVIALGILFVPSIARVVRSDVRTQLQSDYVVNAKLLGASNARILFIHILPNLRATLLVTMAVGFNNAVLAESGMSYLGLGVQPPKASLGRMLSEGQSYIRSAAWTVIFPGLLLVLAVLGVALLSDAYSGNQGDTGSPARIRRRIAGKLLRKASQNPLRLRQFNLKKRLRKPLLLLLLRKSDTVVRKHLQHLPADGHRRIQGCHRLLEHHGHRLPAEHGEVLLRAAEDIDRPGLRAKQNLSGHACGVGQKPHHRERRHALAAAGFPDDSEPFAGFHGK